MAVITQTTRRPNRILMFLAAAWMAASLAIGGTLMDQTTADQVPTRVVAEGAAQP